MQCLHIRVIVVAIMALLCDAAMARAQSAAELFNPDALQEIRLLINSRDLEQLRANFQTNTYYTADLIWRDTRVRNVAVRSRGLGSRNPTKLGLRVDFNRYTTGQQLVGLTSLILDNLWQDPSAMREQLAMAMFDRMGQPASRESYCRLYINNVYQGLYVVVENVNEQFLTRTLGDGTGYLFEYSWTRPFRGEDLGDDLEQYRILFDAETRRLEDATTLYGPIRSLFGEANAADDATWRDRVGRYLDLNQFVTHVAIETFIAEIDGILGYEGMNNFYVYRPAGDTPHRIIPWDKDVAFNDVNLPIFLRAEENVLFRRAMTFADLRTLYLDVLEQCARVASDGDWLAARVERNVGLIDAAVREDSRKQFSNEEYEAEVTRLRDFARRRSAVVLAQVAAAR